MGEGKSKEPSAAKGKAVADRHERLAAALKANLTRRKTQARQRAAEASPSVESDDEPKERG